MLKETMQNYSFIPTDANTLASIDKKYKEYKEYEDSEFKSNSNVYRRYKFKDGSSITVYKDAYKHGQKLRNGKVYMYGRNEDYQEFREKDMSGNNRPIEEAKADSPLIADLNFNHKIIGSDETGKGEPFKYLVVTAAYTNGTDDIKKYIKMGIDDSKETPNKIQKIGEEVTGVHSWNELLGKLNNKAFFVTDCSVTKIITNKEYNKRCPEENVNDILKKAHLEVLKEVSKQHPDSKIVVDNFYDKNELAIRNFKEELSFGASSIDPNHIFVTTKADSKIMAVSLASVISTYICNLGCEYVQEILDNIKENSAENLLLPLNSPGAKTLAEFFSKLRPDSLEDFVNKHAKKRFGNVEAALSMIKQGGSL